MQQSHQHQQQQNYQNQNHQTQNHHNINQTYHQPHKNTSPNPRTQAVNYTTTSAVRPNTAHNYRSSNSNQNQQIINGISNVQYTNTTRPKSSHNGVTSHFSARNGQLVKSGNQEKVTRVGGSKNRKYRRNTFR